MFNELWGVLQQHAEREHLHAQVRALGASAEDINRYIDAVNYIAVRQELTNEVFWHNGMELLKRRLFRGEPVTPANVEAWIAELGLMAYELERWYTPDEFRKTALYARLKALAVEAWRER